MDKIKNDITEQYNNLISYYTNLKILTKNMNLYGNNNEDLDNLYISVEITRNIYYKRINHDIIKIKHKNKIIEGLEFMICKPLLFDGIEFSDDYSYINSKTLNLLIENQLILSFQNNYLNKFENPKGHLNFNIGYIPMSYIDKIEDLKTSYHNEMKLIEICEI